jgi:hypothetical protein
MILRPDPLYDAGDVTTELHMTRIDDDVRAVVDMRHMHRGLAHWRALIEGRSVVCRHLHVRPAFVAENDYFILFREQVLAGQAWRKDLL